MQKGCVKQADTVRRRTSSPDMAVRAEDVISVENEGWMAMLADDPPAQQAPATSP
jgi:hypothetical protein